MKQVRFVLVFLMVSSLAVAIAPSRRMVPVNPQLGSVSPAAPMLNPRSGHSATLLPDGRILIVGGMRRNQNFYKSAELYDPATDKFTVIARMTTRRGRPSATFLDSGDVLIAGGADHDTPGGVASAEIFHAATLTFEPVGSLHYAGICHTATVLNDGRILIAGGRGESVTATAELYDPQSRQFVQTGSMLTARYKHTAGLLPDGRVLIAGGADDRDWRGTMSSAETYDAHIGKFTAASPMNAIVASSFPSKA
jgi:Galactose oxidase, central domain